MTPTTLFILAATCSLAVPVALFLVLWRRDTRRLAADNQASEARERDATSRLAAAEARLAAAEQALSAEKELRQRYEGQVQALTEQRTRTEAELAALRASSEAEIASLRAKNAEDRAAEKAEREKLEETFRAQFRNLATEILGEQSKHFKETNKESLDVLLKPFRDNIVEFRKRVEDIYTTQTAQRGELKAELKNLMELNRRITTETTNLTNALKGNSKVQGDWGEMLLETILDSSALIKGIHYETQYNIKDAEGHNLRPDVVLHLPEKKDIVIDSKVSLTAFVGYTSAETEEERRRCLAAHTASVRQHVNELGRKEYQRLLNSPDFVIMFIPNEPAFLAALQNDAAIWSDAYDKKVIISSPTNLFALLKLVADLWKYNDQDKNTRDIAACGLKLYEQLVAFTGSLEGVGTALDKARDAYDDAYKRLCTGNDNIIRVGERLRRTARLQTKKQHSARTLESAGEDDLPGIPATEAGAGIRFPEPEAKNNRNARRASPGTREARNRGTPEQRNPGTVETGNRGTGNRGTGNRGTGHRSSEEHGNLENMGRAKPPVTCKSPPMFGGLLHFPAGDFPCRAQNPAHGLRGSLQFLRIRTSIPGVASCAIVSTMSSHTS